MGDYVKVFMCSYQNGAKNTAHENLNLVTPNIRWIDIGPEDVETHKIPDHGVLGMTESDITSVKIYLKRYLSSKMLNE
jgi:DNA topoisomerase VI subunit A